MILLVATAHAACPSGPAAVQTSIDRAAAAFGALDEVAFEAARADLDNELGCLGTPLPPELVARAHGVTALDAVIRKDDAAAVAALRAARAADPVYNLPSAVPEGHRLWTMLRQALPTSGGFEPIVAPAGTRPVVDGRASASRPSDRPAIVWLEDDAGKVLWSGLLTPNEPLPDLSRYAVAPPAPEPVARDGRRIRPALAIASAASAVGTGILFAAAAGSAGRFADADTPYAELDGLRGRANALTILGGAGIGVTLALGAATAVTTTEAP